MRSETELLQDLVRYSAVYEKGDPAAASDVKLREITAELIQLRTEGGAAFTDPLTEPRGRIMHPESGAIHDYINGKCVLVTGAAGGVGTRLLYRLLDYKPRRIHCVDKDGERLHKVCDYVRSLPGAAGVEVVALPVDLAEADQTDSLFEENPTDIVFHLAAERNVVTNQLNPESAIRDNIMTTVNAVRAATENGVECFVFSSSRKATMYRPENVLGTTKRLAECVVRQTALRPDCPTKFSILRFVAIVENSFCYHIFEDQIARNQALSVCDISISHVFQNMNEAVNLVLNAGVHANKGELFGARNIGWPIQIIDLALFMIHQSGKSLPVQITGLRAGDNGHEYGVVDPRTYHDTMMFNMLEGRHTKLHRDYVSAWPFEVPSSFDDLLNGVLDTSHGDGPRMIKKLDDAVMRILKYNLDVTPTERLERISKVMSGTRDEVLRQLVQSAVDRRIPQEAQVEPDASPEFAFADSVAS